MSQEELLTPINRRTLKDRRRAPTNPLSISSLFGSRRHCRRAGDSATHPYVDRYDSRSVRLFISILLLSVADAFLTLLHLHMGAVEANPVMKLVLHIGVAPFFLVKYLLTVLAATLLLVHKNWLAFERQIPVSQLLAGAAYLYGTLVIYEILLLL